MMNILFKVSTPLSSYRATPKVKFLTLLLAVTLTFDLENFSAVSAHVTNTCATFHLHSTEYGYCVTRNTG